PDRIAFKDADGKYLVVNRAFSEPLALSSEDIIGRKDPLLPSAPPIDTDIVTDQEVMAESRPFQFETCEGAPDGSTRYFDAIKVPLKDHQGLSMGLVYISRDITYRKRADEEKKQLGKLLRQAQKMEAVGTLAGGIAHDFNNILSAVLGYTEMVIEDTPIDSFIRQNMEQVLQAGFRAKELVQQILTFSRQREQELRPIQPSQLIKEAMRLLRASFPATITITQEINAESSILSDATQFHQVLMNLATNAAHAMREKGGTLTIGLADIDIDDQMRHQIPEISPGPYLRMSVADNGVGIPPAILERIYDPFFTTKPQGVGTGMGLSVVHGIVKSHRGVIEAASTPGQGTEFRVYFPRVEDDEVVNAPRAESIPGGSEHILFVDDEDILVEMSSHLLKRLGYEVTACNNSMDALARFQEAPERFALVITDMTMPKMTGKELATRMLALRPNLPVIMCTGFSEQISEEKAKQIGIRAFIMKPVVVNHLAKTIRRVLDSPPGESARGRPTRLTGRAACRRQPKRIRLRTEPHRMRMTN
ncbi:MAG: ATP-binding protein, partial [Desulfobacterales bacterium]